MSGAKKDSGTQWYPGVDNRQPHTLKAGTLICPAMDYRYKNVKKGEKKQLQSI